MTLRLGVILAALTGAGVEPDETTQPVDSSDRAIVCVLANSDPDHTSPPFNDELILIDTSNGDVVSTVGNLNLHATDRALPVISTSCDGRSI